MDNIKKFQGLLEELFQFDAADLDFGIYRIMNYKRGVIECFIQEDLPELITQELAQGALAGQTQAAKELEAANTVRVNTLIPGPVDSPFRKRAYPAEDKSRLPTMASLAPAYIYLFGPQSLGITGQTVDARTFHL